MTLRFPRRLQALTGAVVLTAAVVVPLSTSALPAGADVLRIGRHASLVVHARGNGHGHGLSQYGANGAAHAGLSYPRILAFYYPHTRLQRMRPTAIRVLLDHGSATTVGAYATMHVTGVRGTLPDTRAGVKRYRLVPGAGGSFTLRSLGTARGARWRTVRAGLPDHASFHQRNHRTTRVYAPDGSSTRYYGYVTANLDGSGGVDTVNRVSLDHYTAGVVPREMPASWARAATNAQAVAARSYGRYAVVHPQNARWDICATTNCQVYGGARVYDAAGNLIGTDLARAAADTADRVLTYGHAVAFTQFSASDGGWSSSGGQPYLVAHRDPYDTVRSGDPYASYFRTASPRTIARYYGFTRLTRIAVYGRDGNGLWGGRAGSVRLYGVGRSGAAKRLSTSGSEFAAVLGLGTTWFTLRAVRT